MQHLVWFTRLEDNLKKLIYILITLVTISACEKYDNDPSKRGYTPEAIDDNAWTVNIIDGDSLVDGMNPKDSALIGTLVYNFMSKYSGYDMVVKDGILSHKHHQNVLIRATDASHINLGIRDCLIFDIDGKPSSLGNIIINGIELKKNGNAITFSKTQETEDITSVEGEFEDGCLDITFNTELLQQPIRFKFMSMDAYKRDYPQVENGDFETWTYDGDDLPNNWNSFQTAVGKYASMFYISTNRQVERSTFTRPNSLGRSSCRIWTTQIVKLLSPGRLTTGRLNIGSVLADTEDNYIFSDRNNISTNGNATNANAMPFTAKPDSVAFWVKFVPISDTIMYKTAKFTACIHDDSDYILYNDEAFDNEANKQHLVAKASVDFESKNGVWQRISVPFEYTTNTNAKYLLIDVSTNSVAGKGSYQDKLYIDDIEMIYRHEKQP